MNVPVIPVEIMGYVWMALMGTLVIVVGDSEEGDVS